MPTILIVEDEPDFRTVLPKVLTDLGYEVATASDGVHGLQAVMDTPLDLILLDWRMPYRDGLQTLRLIRSVQPTTKVIVLGAYMTEAEQAEARKLGAFDIQFKPVSTKILIESVTNGLEAGR